MIKDFRQIELAFNIPEVEDEQTLHIRRKKSGYFVIEMDNRNFMKLNKRISLLYYLYVVDACAAYLFYLFFLHLCNVTG